MEILGFDEADFIDQVNQNFGKGEFHSRGLMKYLYEKGSLDGLEASFWFYQKPSLALEMKKLWDFSYPEPKQIIEQQETHKFTLELGQHALVESVLIPMQNYNTLCVSSQHGCARGCAFCRTATMGLKRNLKAWEIVAQYMTARHAFGSTIRNMVFMGMGEPLDNLTEVMKAISILTNPRGPNLNTKHISISTCGQGQGLLKLLEYIEKEPEKNYQRLTLALSLNASNNTLRNELMPVNRQWPLEELRNILLRFPQSQKKDRLYLEYIIIPGVNDSEKDAENLVAFKEGMGGRVNLIPLNAPDHSPYRSATQDEVERFWGFLRKREVACYSRKRKGDEIQGACGQLAT